jgi:hypothetical protein
MLASAPASILNHKPLPRGIPPIQISVETL